MGAFGAFLLFNFKILVKLNVFTTYLVNGFFVVVKRVDHKLRIDETSRCEHQVLEEFLFILKIKSLNNILVKEVFGKFWNLERIKFVFNYFVSKIKMTIEFIFEILELINVKISNVSHEILVDILVRESTCAVLWIGTGKSDAVLKFGCYWYQTLLINFGLTISC